MIVEIDPVSLLPPYEQLRQQIATMANAGVLKPGQRLPPVRQLANDLGIATGTVARTYRELENAGIVETQPRRGTFIATRPKPMTSRQRQQELTQAARTFANAARQLGIAPDNGIDAIRQALIGN